MQINIKNMVCPRCITAVENIIVKLGLKAKSVSLGTVAFENDLSEEELLLLEEQLIILGFERVKTREMKWVEQIKGLLIAQINEGKSMEGLNLTAFIHGQIGEEYSRLSQLFSSLQGITIERYFINLKIEKAKEWLSYGDFNISEAAWKLGYSSVQHFSSQFKKVSGMTPSEYKRLSHKPRKALDSV